MKRLAQLLFGSLRKTPVVLALLATTVASIVPALPPLFMKRAIDGGVVAHDVAVLTQAVLFYLGAVVLETSFQLASQFSLATLGQRSVQTLRARLFAHLQSLDLGYFEREPRGKILTRVTSDVEALSELFTSGAVTMFADVLLALVIFGTMLAINVRLTLVAFVVVPPMLLIAELFRKRARDAFRAIRTQTARLNAFLSEHLAGAPVILAFAREKEANTSFAEVSGELQRSNKAAIAVDAQLFAVVEAIGTFSVAGMIWFGARGLLNGSLEVGLLVAFIQYVQRFFIPIRDLSSKFTIIQSGLAAAERVEQFLDDRPRLVLPEHPERPALATPITFTAATFSYRPDVPVIQSLDFSLPAGKKFAVVGPTGGGKTTLMKLILRLIDLDSGTVTAGGVPVKLWDSTLLRKKIALVPQEPILFEGSVRDNLTLFDPLIGDDRLWKAARSLGTDALITRLPGGLDASIRERGANLSSGEAQLLAFTRAIVHDPEVLVLDEATSSIDAETEAVVQRGLERLLEGRTALIIAHRLATIRMADEVLVLHRGRLVERGPHEALMQQRGIYYALYELQFAA